MNFSKAIDGYCRDQWAEGRFSSERTERMYRWTLNRLAKQVGNADPASQTREDLKAFLAQWPNPNTRMLNRSVCVSFYDWAVEEGIRADNPARQTRRSRRRPPKTYRLTGSEVASIRDAVRTTRERRLVDLALFAGLRSQELQGLQGRHFRRLGWVWISEDIAKGPRERWQPVPPELAPTWWEIARNVGDHEFVLPRVVERYNHRDRVRSIHAREPMSYRAVHRLVSALGQRAGIRHPIHPHLLRHAFGEAIAEHTGDIRVAQALLGHVSVTSTEVYTGSPPLARLAAAVDGFSYGEPASGLGDPVGNLSALSASSGLERAGASLAPILASFWLSESLRRSAREMVA